MKNFTPIFLIILSVAVFFTFIDPQYDEVKELLAQKEENETMLELARKLAEERQKLQENYVQISEPEKRSLMKLIPDTVDNVRLILDINNIGESFGVQFTGINVTGGEDGEVPNINPTNPTETIGTIGISFSVVATYDLFIEIMKDLEESLRIVDVRSLSISNGGSQNNENNNGLPVDQIFYSYTVSLDTYWLR